MGDFISRADPAVFVRSGNPPLYPDADWIISPQINGQPFRSAGVPTEYVRPRAASPSTLVEEMDAAEKAVVDAAQLSANRDNTADQLDQLEDIVRAFGLAMLDEVNVLRKVGFGGLFRSAPTTAQSVPNNIFTKLNGIVGSNASPIGGDVVVDTVAGEIILPRAGEWIINWNCSFSGSNSVEFIFALFGNGVESDGTRAVRALGTGAGAGVGAVSAGSVVNAPIANVALDLRVFHSEGTPKDVTIESFQINVIEIADRTPRTISQLKTAIRNKLGS